MFLPLVDSLRCPRPHEETWLVASIERVDDRDIVTGMLGCPNCLAEYPIRDGIVYFAERAPVAPLATAREEDAVRVAAALDLTEPRMTAVLHGTWGALAPIMRGLTPAQLLLVNPPAGISTGDGVSIVYADSAPFAHAALHALALDGSEDQRMRDTLIASLRGGSRILGRSAMPIPNDLTELARDNDGWVAVLSVAAVTSAPILPKRRPRASE